MESIGTSRNWAGKTKYKVMKNVDKEVNDAVWDLVSNLIITQVKNTLYIQEEVEVNVNRVFIEIRQRVKKQVKQNMKL
jgi:hypothetical protein